MKVSALVAAAGLGLRLKSKTIKPLVLIDKDPIIIHTLRSLSRHPLINDIVVVFNSKHINTLKKLIKRKNIQKIKDVVAGGSTRAQSVRNGLKSINKTDFVLVHDGARPFVDTKTITKAISAASKFGAAIVGVPVKHTIKRIKDKAREVDCTLRRDKVWEIQTPQVFKKDLIMRAYANMDKEKCAVPDDAFLVELLGHRVALVLGSSLNIKITTPEDLLLAKAIHKIRNN